MDCIQFILGLMLVGSKHIIIVMLEEKAFISLYGIKMDFPVNNCSNRR